MSISMALFTSPIHFSTLSPPYSKHHLTNQKSFLSLKPKNPPASLLSTPRVSADNGAGTSGSTAAAVEPLVEKKPSEPPQPVLEEQQSPVESSNGSATAMTSSKEKEISQFKDLRWIGGTWDLMQFQKGGKTDWDAVIDAEARRRKWLEDNPESSSNENPVVFDTSIVPWWAWIKRYHLPEAELLNGRAAMIGFFMAYFVDSLTGVGLVDQMSNFVCKTLLFVAVVGVLLIRKNEDIDNLKKLIEETTFYDRQWQATWQDENSNSSKEQ